LRYLAAPMTAATLLLWIDRSPTLLSEYTFDRRRRRRWTMTAATLLLWIDRADIATAPNIPLTAAVVVAGNDGGNTTTLDRQGRHCYTALNIPLTAAVVVAGNDYGNTTTLDRQEPTLLLLEYTFDRRRRRRWQ
jgi:hypothetical protein